MYPVKVAVVSVSFQWVIKTGLKLGDNQMCVVHHVTNQWMNQYNKINRPEKVGNNYSHCLRHLIQMSPVTMITVFSQYTGFVVTKMW